MDIQKRESQAKRKESERERERGGKIERKKVIGKN
jgi:hypothetical protein